MLAFYQVVKSVAEMVGMLADVRVVELAVERADQWAELKVVKMASISVAVKAAMSAGKWVELTAVLQVVQRVRGRMVEQQDALWVVSKDDCMVGAQAGQQDEMKAETLAALKDIPLVDRLVAQLDNLLDDLKADKSAGQKAVLKARRRLFTGLTGWFSSRLQSWQNSRYV